MYNVYLLMTVLQSHAASIYGTVEPEYGGKTVLKL